ncbi:hypothetical protein GCM10010218_39170 [Streptomyces mashuensis]|uniref:Uncharacterized protein n=1 Tax=Streptomyces mashuensis TaxID=33904 RepID=A0A919B6I8_9ACTN|nr:hypothetical protein [Streptomyces mashuensis]GHF54102.1 hypothetical protein GCM10010218_39170 [Streptomyces mashuensis]
MPIGLLEAKDEVKAVGLILGENQWDAYNSSGSTIHDFPILADKVAEAQGCDDTGNRPTSRLRPLKRPGRPHHRLRPVRLVRPQPPPTAARSSPASSAAKPRTRPVRNLPIALLRLGSVKTAHIPGGIDPNEIIPVSGAEQVRSLGEVR